MSNKKSGNKAGIMNLITAIINMITSLIMLIIALRGH